MDKKIIKLIANTLEIDEKDIKLESNLVSDLGVESLDLVDLIVAFENEFEIEILDKDVKTLQTVEDIVKYVETHV